jgi:hypothetical protein
MRASRLRENHEAGTLNVVQVPRICPQSGGSQGPSKEQQE